MKRLWRIQTEKDLLFCIRVNSKEDLIKALDEKGKYYSNHVDIPKKNGIRTVCVVDKSCELYRIQLNLKKYFLDNIMLSDRAFGFVKGSHYLDYLSEHKRSGKQKYFLRLDIHDFFGSISSQIIKEALAFSIDAGEANEDIKDLIISILMNGDKLEQGTPIAPVVSNIVFRPLDIRLERYCDKLHVTYSRYADDLLFSSNRNIIHQSRFYETVRKMLSDYGFELNELKTKKNCGEMSLNGFVIGKEFRISRRKMKSLSAVLFFLSGHRFANTSEWLQEYNSSLNSFGVYAKSRYDVVNFLAGNRSFLIDTKRYMSDEEKIARIDHTIDRIEKQIEIIEKKSTLSQKNDKNVACKQLE